MNTVIFVAFDTEEKAYGGHRALREMHRDGTITVYDDAVIVKEPEGQVAVRQMDGPVPKGALGGMITGGLIGLLGGPLGVAFGFGSGTMLGAAFDVAREGIDWDFVEEIGGRLEPGKAAVIAEISEDWQLPLDTRMEAVGGTVVRRTRVQVEDAYLEREIEAKQAELERLEAEKLAAVKAAQTEKAKREAEQLQAKIDEGTRKMREKEDALAAKMRAVEREGEERLATLEAQKRNAKDASEAVLDTRLADVRTEYQARIRRLSEALERRKAAHRVVAA